MVYHSSHPMFIQQQIESALNELSQYDEQVFNYWNATVDDKCCDVDILNEILYDLSFIKSRFKFN